MYKELRQDTDFMTHEVHYIGYTFSMSQSFLLSAVVVVG